MTTTPLTTCAVAVLEQTGPDAEDPTGQLTRALADQGALDLDEQDDPAAARTLTGAMLEAVVLEQMADLRLREVAPLHATARGRLRAGTYVRLQTDVGLSLVASLWEDMRTGVVVDAESTAALIDESRRCFLTGGHPVALAKAALALHLAESVVGAR